jgi:hypothetical protein|tara:strand:+ start:6422 stop:6586 length:165 start_codon:yes stop_codon:yes gene_type:complete
MKKAKLLKGFKKWQEDGNVVKVGADEYVEQSTQWKKRFTLNELKKFFIREFVNV